MESVSHADSDGGGGRRGSGGAPRDDGSPLDSARAAAVLSLDQIRITGSSNDYTEGPGAAPQQLLQKAGARTDERHEDRTPSEDGLHLLRHGNAGGSASSVADDSRGGAGTGSTSVPNGPGGGESIIRVQPKRSIKAEELKPLNIEQVPGSSLTKPKGIHAGKCRDCGRCTCPDCTRPRALPSCWMCGRRCMCSARSAVEYWTCACCVKGLFYHCSSDDEDTCADKPFSCSQSHCCVRWTAVSLLSLLFPCLLCYLPAKGCVALCQSCYDCATRPGCRCQGHGPAKPTADQRRPSC